MRRAGNWSVAIVLLLSISCWNEASSTSLEDDLSDWSGVYVSRLSGMSVVGGSVGLQEHEEWLVSAFGERFVVSLDRHVELLPVGYQTFIYSDHNEMVPSHTNYQRYNSNHCHYTGTVKHHNSSFVALSLCNNAIHGEIQTQSHHFFIEPAHLHFDQKHVEKLREQCLKGSLSGGLAGIKHSIECLSHHVHLKELMSSHHNVWVEKAVPHVAYTKADMKDFHYECGVDGSHGVHEVFTTQSADHEGHGHETEDHEHGHVHLSGLADFGLVDQEHIKIHAKSQFIAEVKYVELVIVNDRFRYNSRGQNLQSVESHTETLVNIAAARYRAANLFPEIKIVLTGQITITAASNPWSSPLCMGSTTEVDHSEVLDNFLSWAWGNSAKNLLPSSINYDNIHLFTSQDFCGGTVGFAPVGAMCYGGKSGGINQITFADQQSANILTHEMGHNFNMLHDGRDNGNSCPNAGYIMASSGCLTCNSYVTEFSTCSKGYFSSMMTYRPTSTSCLDNRPVFVYGDSRCGNGFVEAEEECDCGGSDCSQKDPCCDGRTCKLFPGADCSNSQSCCNNCRIVPRSDNKVCRSSFSSTCDEPEVCDGVYADCPVNVYKAPGTTCTDSEGNSGRCYQGGCLSHALQCKGIYEENTGACGTATCGGALTCTLFNDNGQSVCTAFQAIVGDGTPCDVNSQCFNGRCVSSTSLHYSWSLFCDVSCSGTISRDYRCRKFDGSFVGNEMCVGPKPNATANAPCGSFAPRLCSVNLTTSVSDRPLTFGDQVHITWRTLRQVDYISILLYSDGFATPVYIRASVADTGSFSWTIPKGIPAGVQTVEVIASTGVSMRADRTFVMAEMCQQVSCLNSGRCDSGFCECMNGFRGELCEKSTCASNDLSFDCSNGGTCNTATKNCACPSGFSGAFCQRNDASCTLDCGSNGQVNGNCTSCVCNGFLSGDSCGNCGLNCGAKGKLKDGCKGCTCNDWVAGTQCDVSYANLTLNFNGLDFQRLSSSALERKRFTESLELELVIVFGIALDKVTVDSKTIAQNGTKVSVRFILRSTDLQTATMEKLITLLVEAINNPYSDSGRLFYLSRVDKASGVRVEGDGLFKRQVKLTWYMTILDWIRRNLNIVIPVVIVLSVLLGYKAYSDSRANNLRKMAGVKDPEAAAIRIDGKKKSPKQQPKEVAEGDAEERSALKKKEVVQQKKEKAQTQKKKRKVEKKVRGEDELADEFGVRVVSGRTAAKNRSPVAVQVDANGEVVPGPEGELPPGWTIQYFEDGTPFYFNSVTNDISTTPPKA